GNKVQHGLRAYTPSDQKTVKAAADSFRVNPDFDTYETILNLGTGEAVVSFLDEKGIPSVAQKVAILPPQSCFSAISESDRDRVIKESLLYSKYYAPVDPDSAYEFLQRLAVEEDEAKAAAEAEKAAQKEAEKAEKAAQKEAEKAQKAAEREEQKKANASKKAAQSVGNSVVGTVGRELGKSFGGKFGKFGKTLGGNLGASLGRGLLSTFMKK
ncbi:MAG: DUF853 domain-containing protein, partial [Synergistes sp.]|nr:DUF853 domain-containing protein [Synergistes sp.]